MCGGGTQTTTTKTEIPPEVLARYNSVNARAETAATTPFQQYGGEFVAPLNPTQQAGIQATSNYSQAAQPFFQAATQGLQQAGTAGMAGTLAAYQPLAQGYSQGQQYSDIAGQLYGQIPAAASPYYQMATQGLGAGLQYAGGLNAPAIGAAYAAPYQAAPLQAYGAGAITGAPGAAQGANYAAMRSAMGAQRQAQPYYGAASELTGAGAGSVGALTPQQIAQYQDPYVGSVVGSTLAALQQQQGQERSALAGRQAASGAFGGDRAGLERANLARQQQLATSQAISPLMSQAYQQAVQTAAGQQGVQTQNLARQLQAGQQFAGLGQGLAGLGFQGAQTLSQLGQTQYGQQLGAGQAAAGLGQQLYGQGAQQAQLLSGLGQTGFGQQLQAAQQAASLGQGVTGLGLQTGQALQGLGQQLYGQGAGTAQQQAALAQQLYGQGAGTAQALAGLGTGSQAAALQGAQAQIQAGTLGQQTQQAQDTALYQQFLQERGYPYQQAQFLANIAMGTGALSGNTQTQTAPASFFSDKRLKHDAEKVGEMHDGTPIYRFKYNGSDHTQIGLMAQDVEKRHPEAVGESQGYKTVDYKKATDEAAHKADGGGIMPSWMGGAVHEAGHYAAGGLADADLSALLAQQSKSFGPFGQGGLYGGSAQANPYSAQGGGQAGYVPAGNLHVPKMLQASPAPAPKQTSTASELYSNLKSLDSIASDVTGKGLFQRGRDAAGMGEQSPKKEEVNRPAEAHGGLIPRNHYYGGGVTIPGQPDEQSNPGSESGAQGDVLAKVVKEGAEQAPKQLQQSSQPAPTQQQGSNPLGLIASGIGAAKGIGSIGTGLSSLLGGAGAGAAGAAGAATGIGSALGSVGTGIAQVLPFLAMLSDERAKHNKREVGKLYDGQPVYSFDYGDGRTQLGLMAQHVERKHPEAVAETDGGLKMVDYHRATEHAAEKGHFEQGGLARAGFVAGGPTDETTAPEPDYQAIADYQIAKESRGNPLARATTSSAAGLGQFTDSTAREVLRRNPNLVQGIEYDPTQRGFAATLPESVQRGMALAHARQQAQVLKEQGFEPTKENVRMNWFLGEAGGPAFLRGLKDNPNAPAYTMAGQDQVRANQSVFFKNDGTPRTAQELFDLQTKGIGGGGPTRAGGVMGAMRQAAAPVGEAAEGVTGFLGRNKDIILPVLQGLGAMAGSKSRFLGSAILEGLGAGAKSYSDLQQQTAETTGRETQNLQAMQNLAFGSIKNVGTADRPIYMAMLKNGQMVPLNEWMEKGGDLIGGEPGANYAKFLAKNVQTQAAGRGIEDVGATGQGPGAVKQPPISPAPPPPAPIAGFKVPEESWTAAKSQEFKDTMGMGAGEAAKQSKDYSSTVNQLGQAANSSKPQTNEMVNIVSDLFHGNALDKGGANAGIIAAWQGRLNDIADRSGLGRNFFGNITTSADALEKLNTVSAQLRTTAAGQAAYNALAKNIDALPGIDKDPKSNLINTSMIMVDRQRQEDQWKHAQAYGRVTGNLYNRAYDHFVSGKDPSEYSKEAGVLEKFLAETNPVHVKLMTSGRVTPDQIEEFFTKKYNMPGMSRYFVR